MNKKQEEKFLAAIIASPMSDKGKAYVVDLFNNIRKPEPKEMKIRNPQKAKGLMTLSEWELKNGTLWSPILWGWIDGNELCVFVVRGLVDEFKDEMLAKGKQYSDFRKAFQTYLRKGYLSKPMNACKKKQTTEIYQRGGQL